MQMRWAGPLVLLALVGCAREVGYAGPGESCVRSTQCQAGLACVWGQCTSDLSGLEGGVVPIPMDAGPMLDSGPLADTGVPPMDTGVPPMDTGVPPMDSGPPTPDSGPPPTPDSGPPPTPDSGPPPTPDSGPPPTDAGP